MEVESSVRGLEPTPFKGKDPWRRPLAWSFPRLGSASTQKHLDNPCCVGVLSFPPGKRPPRHPQSPAEAANDVVLGLPCSSPENLGMKRKAGRPWREGDEAGRPQSSRARATWPPGPEQYGVPLRSEGSRKGGPRGLPLPCHTLPGLPGTCSSQALHTPVPGPCAPAPCSILPHW